MQILESNSISLIIRIPSLIFNIILTQLSILSVTLLPVQLFLLSCYHSWNKPTVLSLLSNVLPVATYFHFAYAQGQAASLTLSAVFAQ